MTSEENFYICRCYFDYVFETICQKKKVKGTCLTFTHFEKEIFRASKDNMTIFYSAEWVPATNARINIAVSFNVHLFGFCPMLFYTRRFMNFLRYLYKYLNKKRFHWGNFFEDSFFHKFNKVCEVCFGKFLFSLKFYFIPILGDITYLHLQLFAVFSKVWYFSKNYDENSRF